jgi:hypothetical protein
VKSFRTVSIESRECRNNNWCFIARHQRELRWGQALFTVFAGAMRQKNTHRTGGDSEGSNERITKVAAACQLQLRILPAARRTLGFWSVGKVRTENGGHGCRRLTGWDGKEASLIATGTRAEMTGFRLQASDFSE